MGGLTGCWPRARALCMASCGVRVRVLGGGALVGVTLLLAGGCLGAVVGVLSRAQGPASCAWGPWGCWALRCLPCSGWWRQLDDGPRSAPTARAFGRRKCCGGFGGPVRVLHVLEGEPSMRPLARTLAMAMRRGAPSLLP